MSREDRFDDGRFVNRRNVLKASAVGATGVGVLSGTAAAGGCSNYDCVDDSASSWEKEVHFYGQQDIYKGGTCKYRYATDADEGGQVKRVSSYCESEDCAYHYTDKNGNELAVGGGEVDKGYKDVFEFNGPFRYFDTTREIDVEIYGNFDTTNQWDLTVEGTGDYTVYFADDTAPIKRKNTEFDDDTGVQNGDGYITGTVDGFSSTDDADSYTVYGDIKRIFVDNNSNGTFRIRATTSP